MRSAIYFDVRFILSEEFRSFFYKLVCDNQVMHVLGFDPHAFAHFRDERKRRRVQVLSTVDLL